MPPVIASPISQAQTNPARLYLPLLTHPQAEVHRQACTILLNTYGDRALTYLRRLLDDPERDVRMQASRALLVIREVAGLHVELQPFRGIYVECLGHLRIYIGSREVQPRDWMQMDKGKAGWRKVQGVFAYLVHCGQRGACRAQLAECVWGNDVSASSLARTFTGLRQILALSDGATRGRPILTTTATYCALAPDAYQTDVQLFERTFNAAVHQESEHDLAAAASLYEQTVRLYNGHYMIDVPCAVDWGHERRDLIMNNFIIASERLAEHNYAQRNDRQCIAICRRALDADPTADDVVGWLMRACSRQGLMAELEQTHMRYLRAAEVDPQSDEGRNDPVVQLYRELARPRANRSHG